ncbi:trypsin-like peptidase domain-containing protein [Cylindrospermopsis curvispora]|uniref:trypsin-like peptidase domain-containing protein n=1 Tax=Cylindrospermopsis curvispora TaxID=747548 RepID=UPI001F42CECE|nr:trypsin-like peptidase domain-containing protein [Cylindrospermopsis curvispora]
MYKIFTKAICITCTTLSIVVLTSPQTLAQNIKGIQNLAKKATVQINTDANPGGSGVIIQKQGETYTILTANHVVCENLGTTEIRCRTDFNYSIRTYDGREHAIKHRQSLQKNVNDPDLAIVTFESQQDYEVAPIGNFDDVQIQSDILVAGFPTIFGRVGKNRIFTVTNGKVVGFIPNPPKGYGLVYNATTFIGNSGGPVFDSSGNVIGIHGLADTDGVEIDNKNQSETRNGLKPNVSIIRKLINPQVESGTSFIQKTGFNAGIPINIFLSVTADTGLQLPNVKSPVVIPPRITDQVAISPLVPSDREATIPFSSSPRSITITVPQISSTISGSTDEFTTTVAIVPKTVPTQLEKVTPNNDRIRSLQAEIERLRQKYRAQRSGITLANSGKVENSLSPLGQGNIDPVKVSLGVQPKAVTIAVPRLTEDGNVSVNSQFGVDAIAPNNEPVNPQFVPGNTRRNPSGIRLNVPHRRMNARDSLGKLRGTTVSPSLPPLAAVDIYLPRNTNETINHNFVPRNTTRNRSGIRSNVPTRKINNGASLGKLRSRTVSNTKRPNSLNINDAQAYYNRGVARSNLGDKQGAISDFQTAARLYQQQGNQELYRRALNRISQLR